MASIRPIPILSVGSEPEALDPTGRFIAGVRRFKQYGTNYDEGFQDCDIQGADTLHWDMACDQQGEICCEAGN